MNDPDDTIIKVATIVMLGLILITSVIMIGVVAVKTDRDLFRAELFTFGGALLLAALGGVQWYRLRYRRRWHLSVDREEPENGMASDTVSKSPRDKGVL